MSLEHSHSLNAIHERIHGKTKNSYVSDWILGGIDGAVTTFAIVAGVVGAALEWHVIIILGLANLLADGFSMAASNYSAVKSDADDVKRLWKMEQKHIRTVPEGEREEVRQILIGKGLSGPTLEEAVEAVCANEAVWIETMLVEEYGVLPESRDPLKAALATISAFILCGSVPLVPYVFDMAEPFVWAVAATGVVFFVIGAAKSMWALAPWWRSGLETFAIGMAAAGVSYAVGYWLKGLIG
ncbi:MAG: VIT1/CCC1 transporter family protein [Alphaproteobacteria bacterium]|nr:VIT1/CCC1 transporter family protein [Alphaproteobacteria bacterium]MCB9929134.1 VIT1/CCC1 transporter family protein [Alphaproteobacteria bacterium]